MSNSTNPTHRVTDTVITEIPSKSPSSCDDAHRLTSATATESRTPASVQRYSSHDRPRRVTNAMIADIRAWHAQRMTAREKADNLRLSENTLHNIIRSAGMHYSQPSPEQRPAAIARQRAICQQLRQAHLL